MDWAFQTPQPGGLELHCMERGAVGAYGRRFTGEIKLAAVERLETGVAPPAAGVPKGARQCLKDKASDLSAEGATGWAGVSRSSRCRFDAAGGSISFGAVRVAALPRRSPALAG